MTESSSHNVSATDLDAAAALLRGRLRKAPAPGAADSSIPRAPRDRALPSSPAQERLWVLDRIRPGSTEYLVPIALALEGPLDREAMEKALGRVVDRHEILRTRYEPDTEGRPVQVVEDHVHVPLEWDDLSSLAEEDRNRTLDKLIEQDTGTPFDLADGPVLRARAVRLGPLSHMLLVVVHHIAVDGWSAGVLVDDLSDFYRAGADADGPGEPVVQYADFAAWQRARLDGERAGRGLEYWLRQLADLPALELPLDRPRPEVWDPEGASVEFEIGAELAGRVEAWGAAHGATAFMSYLACFQVLVRSYTGQDDFAVGTPVAGRDHREVERTLGVFLNTLPLRADLSGAPSFRELLERTRETVIEAFDHQEVPFERMVSELVTARDLGRNPLFQTAFVFQNYEPVRFAADGLMGGETSVPYRTAKFDLGWTMEPRADGGVTGTATFPTAMFDPATVRRMADHYLLLLDRAVTAPETRITEGLRLSAEDHALVVRTARTEVECGPSLHEVFAATSGADPGRVAVVVGDVELSYGWVEGRANRIARLLAARGVRRGDLVGVCLSRGVELVPALLGVLKAGAGYVPLDPA
ncbi:condensation domain-containing protein, partial [Nocardiopsis dassonvillei]|uniref:condensation domain-containing protein n=1 Tax=Nocardiopsis dassonvillei TaxID=2014 RepID=UPI00200CF035